MYISIYIPEGRVEAFYQDAISEYSKRLGAYCKYRLVCVKDFGRLRDSLQKETAYVITIRPDGAAIDSPGLADTIKNLGITGRSVLAVVIGTEDIAGDLIVSLTQMDIDYGLQTVMMFEQIYRAYRIIHNQPYHK